MGTIVMFNIKITHKYLGILKVIRWRVANGVAELFDKFISLAKHVIYSLG